MSRIIINNRTQLTDKQALELASVAWRDRPSGATTFYTGYGVCFSVNKRSTRADVLKVYPPNVLAPEPKDGDLEVTA